MNVEMLNEFRHDLLILHYQQFWYCNNKYTHQSVYYFFEDNIYLNFTENFSSCLRYNVVSLHAKDHVVSAI